MYQYAELVHWMKKKAQVLIPASVDIDLTNLCNQDCYYCESAEFRSRSPSSKSKENYLDLLDKLATWRAHSPDSMGSLHTVCFSGGGEPTLFKGYEEVIAASIQHNFQTSLITNGANLEKLFNNIDYAILKDMAWIGVDIDAGNEATYEKIRKTKGKTIFTKVITNITRLVEIGVNVDLKILINEYNSSESELTDIFELAQKLKVRSVYIRPTVLNNIPFDYRPMLTVINHLANRYSVTVKTNLKKFEERTYNRCHQMYQFLIFCPDGRMYTCCENKGNPTFAIGEWTTNDFRDLWLSKQHHSIYNGVNTKLCAPCRSHNHNLAIQQVINNPNLLDTLYY